MSWLVILTVALGLVVAAAAGVAGGVLRLGRSRAALVDAASEIARLGLRPAGDARWSGSVSGREVQVELPSSDLVGVRVACALPDVARPRVHGAPAGPIRSGDPAFDRAVHLEGDPALWLAVLDDEARAALRRAVGAGLRVGGGAVQGAVRIDGARDLIRRAVHLAGLLEPPDHPAAALLQHLSAERDPRVRRRMLAVLLDSPLADDAARAVLGDPEPAVRLLGARHLGHQETLLSLLDPDTAASVRDEAFRLLRREHPAALRDGLLARLDAPPRSARDALARLTALADPSLTPALLDLADRLRDDPERIRSVGADLLRALAAAPSPPVEDRALALLEALPTASLLGPGLALLRRVGTDASIDRLGALAARCPAHHAALVETRSAIAVGVWGERLADALDLRWETDRHRGHGHVDGHPLLVALDPTQASLQLSDLDDTLVVVPRPERLEPLCDDPLHVRFRVAEPALVLAALTPDVRAAWMRVAEGATGCSLRSGRLHLRLPWSEPGAVTECVDRLAAFVRALAGSVEGSSAERLARAWRLEQHPVLQRRLLAALLETHGSTELAPPVAREALEVDDAEQARLAAHHLRRTDVLFDVLRDRNAPARVRAAALRDLASLAPDDLEPPLSWALEEPAVLPAALHLVARHRRTEQLPTVAAWVDRLAPPDSPPERLGEEPVASALKVLCHLRVRETEPWLIRALDAPSADVRRRAILALGEVGAAAGLAALRARIDRGWSLGPEASAMRAAIAAIRERAGAHGGLSMASVAGGEVSVVQHRGGQLSEPEPEPDR